MDLTLTFVLTVFAVGLLVGRKSPMVLAALVFLALGVLVANNDAGGFVHTLLGEAYGLIT